MQLQILLYTVYLHSLKMGKHDRNNYYFDCFLFGQDYIIYSTSSRNLIQALTTMTHSSDSQCSVGHYLYLCQEVSYQYATSYDDSTQECNFKQLPLCKYPQAHTTVIPYIIKAMHLIQATETMQLAIQNNDLKLTNFTGLKLQLLQLGSLMKTIFNEYCL